MKTAFNKKRQEYVNSLYSKKEQKRIKKGVEKLREQTELWIQDYFLLDEEMRIIKKHFKLTPKQFTEIIDKYRVPSKGEEDILKMIKHYTRYEARAVSDNDNEFEKGNFYQI